MVPWELLGVARVPGSTSELSLHRRGAEWSIRCDGLELMNSRTHASEDALATLSCARVAERKRPRVLIGGLGMGFTLRSALHCLPAHAEVVLVELVPEVVEWNRTQLAGIAGKSLLDRRVSVRTQDVGAVLRESKGGFDAILLDVDNGPEAFTRPTNAALYGLKGLEVAHTALRDEGVLAVWSAGPSREFTARLERTGFSAERVSARGRESKGARHTIWLATKRKPKRAPSRSPSAT